MLPNIFDKYKFFAIEDNFIKNSNVQSNCLYGNMEHKHIPLVTIAIPTYRRLELLKEAIASVLAQIEVVDFEIVIVDNDDTGEYSTQIVNYLTTIADERIYYYRNSQNIGVFGNWNRCIELARGKWMTILCDDDILFNNYLQQMFKVINSDSNINRVECKYLKFTHVDKIKIPLRQRIKQVLVNYLFGVTKVIDLQMYIADCFTAPHGQLYKTEYARNIGGFNYRFIPAADYVFNVLYVYKYTGIIQINEYLCGYRILCNESTRPITRLGCLKWYGRMSNFLLSLRPSKLWWCYRNVYFTHYYCSTILKNFWQRKFIAAWCKLGEKILLLMLNKAR